MIFLNADFVEVVSQTWTRHPFDRFANFAGIEINPAWAKMLENILKLITTVRKSQMNL